MPMLTNVLFPVATVLRAASRIICLIVIVSFVIFAVNETGSASNHQQNVVNEASTNPVVKHTAPVHKSSVHKAIDDVANALTSPFSGITAGSNSEWAVRGVDTVIALLVYGLGLGYLARVLRIRV